MLQVTSKSKNFELVCRTIKGLFGVCFESSKPLIKQTFPEKCILVGKQNIHFAMI